jgi:hypothetical protein
LEGWHWDVLLFEGLLEEPDDDGQVAALVVGGEQDGVFVADCHGGRRWCFCVLVVEIQLWFITGGYKRVAV